MFAVLWSCCRQIDAVMVKSSMRLHTAAVQSLLPLLSHQLLATAGLDTKVYLWDASRVNTPLKGELSGHKRGVRVMAYVAAAAAAAAAAVALGKKGRRFGPCVRCFRSDQLRRRASQRPKERRRTPLPLPRQAIRFGPKSRPAEGAPLWTGPRLLPAV